MSDNMDNVPILKDGTANPNFLMTRKQAISVLQVIRSGNMKSDGNMLNKIICDKAISLAIRDLKRPHVEWIPCSERLPDKNGFYLITFKTYEDGRGVIEKFYRKTENIWTDDGVHRGFFFNSDEVTAWRLLPEPYKEEGDEK